MDSVVATGSRESQCEGYRTDSSKLFQIDTATLDPDARRFMCTRANSPVKRELCTQGVTSVIIDRTRQEDDTACRWLCAARRI